jgi:phenylalanyl-tRNA synthetase alpha chain
MDNNLEQLKNQAIEEIKKAVDINQLRDLEIKYLGRKGGELTKMMGQIENFSGEERKRFGAEANEVKKIIIDLFEQRKNEFEGLGAPVGALIDVTAPGILPPEGHLHMISQAIEEIEEIFKKIGFNRVRYPEVEWDWYAFEGLNMPKDHPARDEWETFFIDAPEGEKGKMVLTPHTSNGQLREMEKGKLPIRMINISKTYRRQSDISHVPMFHQFEGLYIDKNVTVSHLKGVFDYFVKQFFGSKREIRLRPYHFQFTEPSFEIDISCGICGGSGKLSDGNKCRLCKEGWLELGGAGMVHPNVLKAGGVDHKKYNGFAFGWGVERTYMMKAGLKIDDIRMIYKNDLRFLEQF